MKQRTRIYYTDTQKALMWDRWKDADGMVDKYGPGQDPDCYPGTSVLINSNMYTLLYFSC